MGTSSCSNVSLLGGERDTASGVGAREGHEDSAGIVARADVDLVGGPACTCNGEDLLQRHALVRHRGAKVADLRGIRLRKSLELHLGRMDDIARAIHLGSGRLRKDL